MFVMRSRVTRRTFLKTAGTAGAAYGLGLAGRFPQIALGQEREVSVLMFSSFVPANDEELRRQAAEFGRKNGVKVTMDFISIPEMAAKHAAEVQAQRGHDIIALENLQTAMVADQLEDVDEITGAITKKWGAWHPVATQACFLNGHWKAVPRNSVAFHGTYREDYFSQVGERFPASWNDILRAAKKLRAADHPVGFAVSQAGDSNNSLQPLLWAFGGKAVTAQGEVAIMSPETEAAIAYVQEIFPLMDREVLAWDNAGNNRFILSGRGSWTLNPVSVYMSSKGPNPDLAGRLNHHGALLGPKGRFGIGDFYSFGLWKFSRNKGAAKELLQYFYEEENQNRFIESGGGFNLPAHPKFDRHPVWRRDPKLEGIIGYTKWQKLTGWPAPPDRRAQAMWTTFVVPNMFAQVVTGKLAPKVAMEWAARQLHEIGYK
jgi:multiple sugar transport system substrate-binding protein